MKILVVEDSRFTRNMIKKELSLLIPDAEIELAVDGLDGLEKYDQTKYEVIVSDLLMPRLSGETMIEKIREKDKSVKIIVMTADIQMKVQEELAMIGITRFVNKPFNRDKAHEIAQIILGDSNVE